jgi:enoyl-CoA hydratase/carnithine racemase
MNFAQIGYHVSGRVLTITLDNSARRNAFGPEMEQEMRTALEAGDRDPEIRAIIITGAGESFCVGADMSVLAAIGTDIPIPSPPAEESDPGPDFEANYQRRFTYMLRLSTPVIAAINGPAAGVGVSICLFCDFRFMVEGAKLSTSFSRRGLIAEHGSSWMLSRLIGPMNALDLLMTGRKVTATEAAQMGLVRCLPRADFTPHVAAFAADLAENASPRSASVMKRQVYDALMQNLGEACAIAEREEALSFSSADFAEGVAHFVERRPARFVGR